MLFLCCLHLEKAVAEASILSLLCRHLQNNPPSACHCASLKGEMTVHFVSCLPPAWFHLICCAADVFYGNVYGTGSQGSQ